MKFNRYFQETSWLLDHDPSVFAVNAFSYNSVARVASDVSALRRVEAYPYYGWMMARETFKAFVLDWKNEEVRGLDVSGGRGGLRPSNWTGPKKRYWGWTCRVTAEGYIDRSMPRIIIHKLLVNFTIVS